jgi:asparagine synthase (glutamine-hydrolysing)
MCGIAGFVDFKGIWSESDLRRMAQTIVHRGPDDEGIELLEVGNARIGLAHRRLSILDLSSFGHQPMKRDHIQVVYNGEIYNYKEIREDLLKLGYCFTSETDTEVLICAFQEWGTKAIDKFIGMFAFALVDLRLQKAWFVRDRVGIKPLYYGYNGDQFFFASELKSLVELKSGNFTLSQSSLSDYLRYGYTIGEHSIYSEVSKLKAGHFLELDLKAKSISENCYWSIDNAYASVKHIADEVEILDELETLLNSACKYRMISDVPIGIFLSGGYDSSLVTALVQKQQYNPVKTFTIGFTEQTHNEAPFAKSIAQYLGTEHHEFICTEEDALNLITKIPYYFDEPFGDSSAIPTMLVSAMARQFVTVALSADAGDEIFGGYTRYANILKNAEILEKLPFQIRIMLEKVAHILPIGALSKRILNGRYEHIIQNAIEILPQRNIHEALLRIGSRRIATNPLKKLLKNDFVTAESEFDRSLQGILSKAGPLHQIMAIDYKTYLTDDILVKVDRATMSASLEGREPLLDHRLIEYVASIPENYKINNGNKKYLLKKITERHIPKVLLDRPKQGFAIPVNLWMRNQLKPLLLELLGYDRIRKQGIFVPNEIDDMVKAFLKGSNYQSEILWFIFMFQLWSERWKNY